jgi:hypothetical protein
MVSPAVFICSFAVMEVILVELRKNYVDIDMRTLSHHVKYLPERHRALCNQVTLNVNPEEMYVVFNTLNVTNFGTCGIYC